MKRYAPVLALTAVLGLAGFAAAESEHAAPAAVHSEGPAAAVEETTHPTIPAEARWSATMVIAILALFAAAVPVGLFVRANMPQEVPPAAHDDHAAGHDDHGHGGHH